MSKLDRELDSILGIMDVGSSSSLEEQIEGLDDENRPREGFALVEYVKVDSQVVDTQAPVGPDTIDDYKYSRSILYGLISRGTAALEGALMVAKESENPRAYETASNIMRNISDMTKDLLALQKALNPTVKGSSTPNAKNVTNIQQNNNYGTQETTKSAKEELIDLLGSLDDDDKQ